jgi:hypothetical protein
MATASCTAVVVGSVATLVTVPTNMKAKLNTITIDNQSTARRTINFRDSFTPDPYDGTASPSGVTPARGQYSLDSGLTSVISCLDLKGREFIGAIQCYADATEPDCVITIDYDLE